MRINRILAVIILVLFLASMLSGCFEIPFYKYYEIDPQTVSSIQVYELWDVYTENAYFLKTEEPVYTLPASQNSACLGNLAKLRFRDSILIMLIPAAVDPNFSFGQWTLRVNYTDGSFLLLSDMYGERFDANGEHVRENIYSCDDQEEWYAFIAQYVPEDIFQAGMAKRDK